MSSHADTIRLTDALESALERSEAENQRLEEQRDTALRKIADWQAIAESSKAEKQRLRDEYIYWRDRALAAERSAREALAGDAE